MKNVKSTKKQAPPEIRHSERLRYNRECMACKDLPAEGIELHVFPINDYEDLATWPPAFYDLKPQFKKTYGIKLCSLHFERNCFVDDDMKILKPHSIPTLMFHPIRQEKDEPKMTSTHLPVVPCALLKKQSKNPSLEQLTSSEKKTKLTSSSQLRIKELKSRPLIDRRRSQSMNKPSTSQLLKEESKLTTYSRHLKNKKQTLNSEKKSTILKMLSKIQDEEHNVTVKVISQIISMVSIIIYASVNQQSEEMPSESQLLVEESKLTTRSGHLKDKKIKLKKGPTMISVSKSSTSQLSKEESKLTSSGHLKDKKLKTETGLAVAAGIKTTTSQLSEKESKLITSFCHIEEKKLELEKRPSMMEMLGKIQNKDNKRVVKMASQIMSTVIMFIYIPLCQQTVSKPSTSQLSEEESNLTTKSRSLEDKKLKSGTESAVAAKITPSTSQLSEEDYKFMASSRHFKGIKYPNQLENVDTTIFISTITFISSVSVIIERYDCIGSTVEGVNQFIMNTCLTKSEVLAANSGEHVFVLDKPMIRYGTNSIYLFMCLFCADFIYSADIYIEHECVKSNVKPENCADVLLRPDFTVIVNCSLLEYKWKGVLLGESKNVHSILPRAGATMDISFDEQTKQELLLLKGNIEGLLKMGKRS